MKIFLLSFLFILLLKVNPISALEVNKCFPDIDNKNWATRTTCAGTTTIDVTKFRCIGLPINVESRNKTISNRGNSWKKNMEYGQLCEAFIDNKNFEKFNNCKSKFGYVRRQNCIENNKVFVYQPSAKLNGVGCANDYLDLKTFIVSSKNLNNKKTCDNLKKFDKNWEWVLTPFYSSTKNINNFRFIDYEEYLASNNTNNNINITSNSKKYDGLWKIESQSTSKGCSDFFLWNNKVIEISNHDANFNLESTDGELYSFKGKVNEYETDEKKRLIMTTQQVVNGFYASTEGWFFSNKGLVIKFSKISNDWQNMLSKCVVQFTKQGSFEEEQNPIQEEPVVAEAPIDEAPVVAEAPIDEAPNEQVTTSPSTEENTEELFVIGSGTGFFVNDEGYVVTNEHVAGICQSLASYINGETHIFNILALDNRNDLALLRGEYRNKTFLNINPLGAEFGQDIMAFGFPLAENLSSSVKLTRGIVSSLSGPENDISLIQIDAAIQPGNSGGPVLNYNGQVVGVASSGLNKVQMLLDEESPYIPENVNFAVAATTLTGFLKSNSVKIFNESFDQKSSQELAKIGMPPTIQLHCLNTIAAHNQLRESENYNDILLKKVVNLK